MPRILLVEDNEMNRDMLSRRLQRKGYSVLIAVDGEQGLATAYSEMPDLILMEQSFPEAVDKALQAQGYATKRRGHIGLVNAIAVDSKNGDRLGAADPRDNGAAVGY